MVTTMKRISLAALAALSLLCGCRHTEQEIPDSASLKTVRFLAGTADTRTAFADAVDGVYQTLWTENDSDVLLSLNYGKAESSAVTVSPDGKTASFEAVFDASAASAPYTFYAISPASAARAISPSRHAWSIYIAADQTPLATSVDEAAQLVVARSAASETLPDEVALHFSHLTAYGRITLKDLSLGNATVRKAELVFSTPVVGEWYLAEDGTLSTANGASHTITLTTDASGDLWFACAPVDVSGETLTLALYTDQGNLVRKITFPEGRRFTSGKVARFSVDMAGIGMTGETGLFSLVTSESDLQAGDQVLIVCPEDGEALGAQAVTGSTVYREPVSVSISGNRITDPGDATVLTLETGKTSGTWSFHTGSGYLASKSSGNHLYEVSAKNGYSSWTVSISDGTANVYAQSGSSRYLRYNASSPRFSCYKETSQGMKKVALYKKENIIVAVEDDPLAAGSGYGCYFTGATRAYVKGSDQLVRSYDGNGRLEFVLLNASTTEQLVVTGFDPSLVKGDQAHVSVWYRRGTQVLLDGDYDLTVVREDGSTVWLGDGTGQGIILKK